MSIPHRPKFDNDATLDELAGVGRHRRFDEVVDDDEDESIQVICRKPNPSPRNRNDRYVDVPLAKPSRAFYFGDRNLYEEEAKRYDQDEKARILNTAQFRNNLQTFEELKKACQRGFVIPFVGAGISKSVGLPEWGEYLLRFADDANLSREELKIRLTQKGDYEGVMEDIVSKLGEHRFQRDFERDFQLPEVFEGTITLLPQIFDGPVITTNFDRAIEKAYEKGQRAFIEKVSGRGNAGAFFRGVPAGERYLLKLHGNIDNASERILRKAEYESAYGEGGNVHLTHPLPKVIKRLFTSYSFFFLGCSLSADRTIQTFMRVASDEGPDSLPHHYALLPCPADRDARDIMDRRLADAHISPLWYPEGEYEVIEEILQILAH